MLCCVLFNVCVSRVVSLSHLMFQPYTSRYNNNTRIKNETTPSSSLKLLHQLLLGTLRTDDIVLVGDESAAHQAGAATRAVETIVVPVSVLEGDELGAADASDRFVTPVRH